MRSRRRLFTLATFAVATTVVATIAAGTGKRLVRKPAYDPDAARVELFAGIESEQLHVTLVPKNALRGSVFIENRSQKRLTVTLPRAVAAVQVLKQGFGGAGVGRGGGQAAGGAGGQGGQGQALGGGFGAAGGAAGGLGGGAAGGGGNGFGNAGGGGFFTVPAQAVVQVPLTSVCLEHGKSDPLPKMTYKLIPLENYTGNIALREFLLLLGSNDLDPGAAQAAAWCLANDMDWETLAAKTIGRLGGVDDEPYFSAGQIAAAQELVATARARAAQQPKRQPDESSSQRRDKRR